MLESLLLIDGDETLFYRKNIDNVQNLCARKSVRWYESFVNLCDIWTRTAVWYNISGSLAVGQLTDVPMAEPKCFRSFRALSQRTASCSNVVAKSMGSAEEFR